MKAGRTNKKYVHITLARTKNQNGNFGLVFGWEGNTTHIHDFCIPLDFLGTKDVKKIKKAKKNFKGHGQGHSYTY